MGRERGKIFENKKNGRSFYHTHRERARLG
jgi:hypothetical protein